MKIYYLRCPITQEYAVVFAKTKQEAFKKLSSKREIETKDISYWDIEELTEESYSGVLYFY